MARNAPQERLRNRISGAEFPLSKIFSSDFDYVIPSYQRPYAWTVDETSELFDDLHSFFQSSTEEPYFLGSIVLIKEENEPYSEVVDGQQRLTTLTILMAAIASKFSDERRGNFVNYIKEPGNALEDIEPKPRLALRERDRAFFTQHVQELQFDGLLSRDTAQLSSESQKNIQLNSKLLLERLERCFDSNAENLFNFGRFLVGRCYLVAVSTPSQKSAFRVFSVLNNRGLDLLPTDIIKADVIGRISPERQDELTEKWEELEVQTGREGFNDLFGHIRMIYAREKAKRSLLEEFKEHVWTNSLSSENLVEQILEPYTEAYLIAKNQQYASTENAKEVNLLLKWLNRIDNSDWLPPAIQFLSQNKGDSVYVLWFFRKLERLAAYLHICAKNVNQRIERYAKVLESLQGGHSLNAPIETVELTDSEIEEMKKTLDGDIYDQLTSRRRNYLILRLDSFLSDGAASYDPSILTIEHVLPQTVPSGSNWEGDWPDPERRQKWVHRIANLVPLTRKRNSSAQNYDFRDKKDKYFVGRKEVTSYTLTSKVLSEDDWTPAVVERRQDELLGVLAESWGLDGKR